MSFNVRPSGNIGFTVTGLNEIIRSLDAMNRDIPVIRSAVLNEGARFFVNEAKKNVHRVSGDLYNSIGIESQTSNSVTIAARTAYAAIENARAGSKVPRAKTIGPYGPHNYWSRAITAFQTQFQSRIKVSFDKLWQKHKR
jgi:Ribonuclease G/E